MREWIVIEEEAAGSKPYTPLPLSFDDAVRLRDNLTFKESYLNKSKGIVSTKVYKVIKLVEYLRNTWNI